MAARLQADGILDPKVLRVDVNTLKYQVPGGMLSNLINQLKQAGKSDKLYEVLAEVPRVREDFGYPPLVTPTSQIVGTQAVMNVITGERYKMNPKESQGLMRGEYGRLPAPVNEEVRRKVIGDQKVITCRPADLIKPELEGYRKADRPVHHPGGGRAQLRPVPAGRREVLQGASGGSAGAGQLRARHQEQRDAHLRQRKAAGFAKKPAASLACV